jgi:hypothetical protein
MKRLAFLVFTALLSPLHAADKPSKEEVKRAVPVEEPKTEKKAPKPAEAQKAPETQKAPEGSKTPETPAKLKILSLTVSGGVANVTVTDEKSRRVLPLPFVKDEKGNQLISATLEAESGQLKVIALIEGVRHELKQEVKQRPIAPARSRGPSDEDRRSYEALSDKAKEKFRQRMREMFSNESFRNSSEEERRDAIRKMFDQIQQQDGKAASEKPAKP